MRWSDAELQLIRDVFKDEEFVLAVRDVMMGFEQKFTHETSEPVLAVLKKCLLPTNQPGIPLQMQQDLCHISLGFVAGCNADQGILRIEAFDLAMDYIGRRYNVLLGQVDAGESLDDLKDKTKATKEERFVRMLAYLLLNEYIEKNLNILVTSAKSKEVSPEELKKKQEQDSSK